MPLTPDQIESAKLPRATIGGYKVGPTTDLLHRVSWDYRQIVHQHAVVVEEANLLRVRVAELEQELQKAKQAVDERRDPDELTRVVLSAAQRTAREVREAARQEAETTLRKARRRAAELERQVTNRRTREVRELAALEAARESVHDEIRSALESLKSALVDEQELPPVDRPVSGAVRIQ
jgi:cell division septum initiation protein DivIVA